MTGFTNILNLFLSITGPFFIYLRLTKVYDRDRCLLKKRLVGKTLPNLYCALTFCGVAAVGTAFFSIVSVLTLSAEKKLISAINAAKRNTN